MFGISTALPGTTHGKKKDDDQWPSRKGMSQAGVWVTVGASQRHPLGWSYCGTKSEQEDETTRSLFWWTLFILEQQPLGAGCATSRLLPANR